MNDPPVDPARISEAVRKMHEDPLFLIKKQEAKHKQALIENPLIRERVKQMMMAELGGNSVSQSIREDRRDQPRAGRYRRSLSPDRSSYRRDRSRHDEGSYRSDRPSHDRGAYRDDEIHRREYRDGVRDRYRRSRSPSRPRRRRSGSRDRRPQRYEPNRRDYHS